MKRRAFEDHLRRHGCYVHREGGAHTIYVHPSTHKAAAVPRHNEIKTGTLRRICRDLEIPVPIEK
ncbi:MAG TPA: type II toxin-antitoxin system HicA family toxin [Thermoanaerobaculia bacterium]|jgi:predicted RNA binding protein YcfA (HicA-like mRNA interferase family)|nr:type II toxin-antitoxin system HicA family toxin [Thermoanaerobaculia bacterium]